MLTVLWRWHTGRTKAALKNAFDRILAKLVKCRKHLLIKLRKPLDKPCLLLYNISRQLKTLRNCVMAARQTLTLFVWVQILVPQPKQKTASCWVLFFLFWLIKMDSSRLGPLRVRAEPDCPLLRKPTHLGVSAVDLFHFLYPLQRA